MVPQPVKAIILLFPRDESIAGQRKAEDERIAREGQPLLDKTILWIKQTVRVYMHIFRVLCPYMR